MWDGGVAVVISIALDQLRSIPYVLMVPGEDSRTIWPGLANKHLRRPADPDGRIDGKLPLPGPPRKPPAAVVRVTPMAGGIRPVPGAANPKAPKYDQSPVRARPGRREHRPGPIDHPTAIRRNLRPTPRRQRPLPLDVAALELSVPSEDRHPSRDALAIRAVRSDHDCGSLPAPAGRVRACRASRA